MKTLLTIALLILATASSPVQGEVSHPLPGFVPVWGTVQFQNGQITFATPADRLVYHFSSLETCCSRLVGTNVVAGLYYVPGADQNMLSPTAGIQAGALARFRDATTTVPGVWNNGAAGNTRTLEGVAIGSMATLQVRVWDISKFSTFAQAYTANQFGWSQPFNFRAPDFVHGDLPNAAYMEGLRAFVVDIPLAPEPSALALGGFGLLGLLALRRRRRGPSTALRAAEPLTSHPLAQPRAAALAPAASGRR